MLAIVDKLKRVSCDTRLTSYKPDRREILKIPFAIVGLLDACGDPHAIDEHIKAISAMQILPADTPTITIKIHFAVHIAPPKYIFVPRAMPPAFAHGNYTHAKRPPVKGAQRPA